MSFEKGKEKSLLLLPQKTVAQCRCSEEVGMVRARLQFEGKIGIGN